MLFSRFFKCVKHKIVAYQQKRDESIFEGTVRYIYDAGKTKRLLIVFSGIGGDYNFRTTLRKSEDNVLYIKDIWAHGVSYYLFENGTSLPEQLTSSLIDFFISSGRYDSIVTIGSSKGGTAALYYGIKYHCDKIYIGSCQFELGKYIGRYHKFRNPHYYHDLMGNIKLDEGIALMNSKIIDMLKSNSGICTKIILLYSTEEHTYQEHIVPLLSTLDACGISYETLLENFTKHSMVGIPFKKLLRDTFVKNA